jgi:hypothetical protein
MSVTQQHTDRASVEHVEEACDAYWRTAEARSAPEVQTHAPACSEDGQRPEEADTTVTPPAEGV